MGRLWDKVRGCEATLCAGDGEPEETFGFWARLILRLWLNGKRIVWFIEKITKRS
jgi:hypothetical protein